MATASGSGSDAKNESTPGEPGTPSVVQVVVEPGRALGTLHVKIAGYGGVTGFDRVELRLGVGAVPADCSSGTLLSAQMSSFDTIEQVTDVWPDTTYGVLACAYAAGKVIATGNGTGHAKDNQTVFVTSDTYDGFFMLQVYDRGPFANGAAGANFRCQHLADLAGKGGKWVAIASERDEANLPRTYGALYNNKATPEKIADSRADFWSAA